MIASLHQVLFSINGVDVSINMLFFSLVLPFLSILVVFFLVRKMALFFYQQIRISKHKNGDTQHRQNTQKIKNIKDEEFLKKTKRIKKIILFLESFSIILILVSFISQFFPLKTVFSVFTSPLFVSGKTKISFVSIFIIFLIIYIANIFSIQSKKIIKLFLSYNKNFSKGSIESVSNVIRYISLIIVFLVGLPIAGIDISSFVVLFSAFGLGIGFGLQDTIANYAAGITINLTNIIREGDRVVIRDIEGSVQRIRLLNTVIRSVSLEELIVPNKYIINELIQNLSHSDKNVLIMCSVQVSYESDLEFVKDLVVRECKKLPYLYNEDVVFRLESFDDSGITIKVVANIEDVTNKFVAKSELNMLLWKIFKENNISIPYPQLDVRVKDLPKHKE